MNKLKGILIDVNAENVSVETLDDDLKAFYDVLNCTALDITSRRIGTRRQYFSIICGDEAMLKNNQIASAFDDNGCVALGGNLFITGATNEEGKLTSLTDEDVKYIRSYIVHVTSLNHPKPYLALTQCGLFA